MKKWSDQRATAVLATRICVGYKYVLINDNVQSTVNKIKKIIEYNNMIDDNNKKLNDKLKKIINH